MASSILRFHSLTARLLKDAFLKDGFRQNFFSKIFVLERILLKEFFDLILREEYRVKGTDGKFQDTNDSSVDVKIEHRSDFKGYPEGWRNE